MISHPDVCKFHAFFTCPIKRMKGKSAMCGFAYGFAYVILFKLHYGVTATIEPGLTVQEPPALTFIDAVLFPPSSWN